MLAIKIGKPRPGSPTRTGRNRDHRSGRSSPAWNQLDHHGHHDDRHRRRRH